MIDATLQVCHGWIGSRLFERVSLEFRKHKS